MKIRCITLSLTLVVYLGSPVSCCLRFIAKNKENRQHFSRILPVRFKRTPVYRGSQQGLKDGIPRQAYSYPPPSALEDYTSRLLNMSEITTGTTRRYFSEFFQRFGHPMSDTKTTPSALQRPLSATQTMGGWTGIQEDTRLPQSHQRQEKALTEQRSLTTISPQESSNGVQDDALMNSALLRALDRNCSGGLMACNTTARYRAADGTCNNLNKPKLGAAGQPFQRLLSARYQENLGSPRTTGRNGLPLPSPREISHRVHTESVALASPMHFTSLMQQFGQLVAHEVTRTELMHVDMTSPACCPSTFDCKRPSDPCCSFSVARDDPMRTATGMCMPFIRSAAFQGNGCSSGTREQKNLVTSFIDASAVYGSSEDEMRQLRSGVNGKLKAGTSGLLPPADAAFCIKDRPEDYCFQAGDKRVNQDVGLAALHTVFLREHNRLATVLASLNPQWDDETLFQQSRKIVGAVLQHVIYDEWLPLLVGPKSMTDHRLNHLGSEHMYSSVKDPSIFSVFATAAFRFGHSLIPWSITYGNRTVALEKTFHHPHFLLENGGQGLDKIIKGLLEDPSNAYDRYFSPAITMHLFEEENAHGLDLVAMDIQRGRDHGLAPYNDWRRFCHLAPIRNFNQSSEGGRALAQVYRDVEDVDLFTGGVTETPEGGAAVGPTFACLIALQFHHLKYGDRFWFEYLNPQSGFTSAQVRAIKNTSISRLLCDNTDIASVQKNAFLLKDSKSNPVVFCSSLSSLDLMAWRDS